MGKMVGPIVWNLACKASYNNGVWHTHQVLYSMEESVEIYRQHQQLNSHCLSFELNKFLSFVSLIMVIIVIFHVSPLQYDRPCFIIVLAVMLGSLNVLCTKINVCTFK
jgi:hypothetical protein